MVGIASIVTVFSFFFIPNGFFYIYFFTIQKGVLGDGKATMIEGLSNLPCKTCSSQTAERVLPLSCCMLHHFSHYQSEVVCISFTSDQRYCQLPGSPHMPSRPIASVFPSCPPKPVATMPLLLEEKDSTNYQDAAQTGCLVAAV